MLGELSGGLIDASIGGALGEVKDRVPRHRVAQGRFFITAIVVAICLLIAVLL